MKNAIKAFTKLQPNNQSIELDLVGAFEINRHANCVYNRNFPETRIFNKNIESLSETDIPFADIWLLSPPCQPFTKGGSKKDSDDPRSKPFLKLIEVMLALENSEKLPRAWFVENVVNFETSNTHKIMMAMLNKLNFETFEFILSPTQVGIPNTRVRYYCISIRNSSKFPNLPLNRLKSLLYKNKSEFIASHILSVSKIPLVVGKSSEKSQSLNKVVPFEYQNIVCALPYEVDKSAQILQNSPTKIGDVLLLNLIDDKTVNSLKELALNIVKSNPSFKFDIVNIHSKASTTFTKSYIETRGRGGPLLDYSSYSRESALSNIDHSIFDHIFNTCSLDPQRFRVPGETSNLRCFHPCEILSIMGFPINWFDELKISLKQKYSLIGNSISVYIASILLHFMLELLIINY
ncbi:DNA methyltransferase PMT1 - like protein [Cryptosporidium felis]|nr:DNA methyltransferase PMT1 - like protein [Cryptosporidium felis]